MIGSIIDSLKGELSQVLTSKLGLNELEVDKSMAGSREAFEKTISGEVKNNGVETILNLFSNNENSVSSNALLKGFGGNMISSNISKGFNLKKASSITSLILPMIVKAISKNVNGDSGNLTKILKSDGISSIASNLLKDKSAGLLKRFFNKKQ